MLFSMHLQLVLSYSQSHPWFQLSTDGQVVTGKISDGQRFNSQLYGKEMNKNPLQKNQFSCKIIVLNRFQSGTFFYAHIPVESKFGRLVDFSINFASFRQLNDYLQNLPYSDGKERKDYFYSYEELVQLIKDDKIQFAQLSCGFLQTNVRIHSKTSNSFVVNFENETSIQIKFRKPVVAPVLLELQAFRRGYIYYMGMVTNQSGTVLNIQEDNLLQVGPPGINFLRQWNILRECEFVVWAGATSAYDSNMGSRLQDMGDLLNFTKDQQDKYVEEENSSNEFEVYNVFEQVQDHTKEYISLNIQNFAYFNSKVSFDNFGKINEIVFDQRTTSFRWVYIVLLIVIAVVVVMIVWKTKTNKQVEPIEIKSLQTEAKDVPVKLD